MDSGKGASFPGLSDDRMKILHITLHYVDGWGYQDNLLPQSQVAAGHEVVVATDSGHLPDGLRASILAKGNRYRDGGVLVRRFRTGFCTRDSALTCCGLAAILEEEAPDLVFHHGLHLPTLIVASRYRKKHPASVLMVDSHADPFNASRIRLWRWFYARGVLRLLVKRAGKWVDRFYGVTPLRCSFLETEYRVPSDKIALLPLAGAPGIFLDHTETDAQIRASFSIPETAFLMVSGGKMGRNKGTDRIVEAWRQLKLRHPEVELLLFGSLEKDFQVPEGVHLVGWCDLKKTYSILKVADVAVWPLLHTTLVEDSLSCGTPVIVKDSGNVAHYKAVGAGVFLERGDVAEIIRAVETILEEKDAFRDRLLAVKERYSYASVAKQIEADYQSLRMK